MRIALLLATALLAACAATPPASSPSPAPVAAAARPSVAVRNAGFEDIDPARACPPGWGCAMHADPSSFRFFAEESSVPAAGKSACIERVTQEPWAVMRQQVRHEQLRGANLRLSMWMRVEGATGPGAGPWVLVEGPQPVNEMQLAKGTQNWTPAHVDFTVPPNATALVIGATLEGPGKACFDDVRLEIR
jgi:hypothetical protein